MLTMHWDYKKTPGSRICNIWESLNLSRLIGHSVLQVVGWIQTNTYVHEKFVQVKKKKNGNFY